MRLLLYCLLVLAAFVHPSLGRLHFSEAGHVVNAQGWMAFLQKEGSINTLRIVNVETMAHTGVELSRQAAYPVVFDKFIFAPYIDGRHEVYSFDGKLVTSGRLPSVESFGGAEVLATKGRMAIIAVKPPSAKGENFKYELLIVDVDERSLQVSNRQKIDRYGPMSFFRGKVFIFGEQGTLEVPIVPSEEGAHAVR